MFGSITLRASLALAIALGLQGCATEALKTTSASPSTPWHPQGETALPGDFSVSGSADIAALPSSVSVDLQPGNVYQLPELIDIAQRNNPLTRIAWEQARQLALASGMVEATFLPILTANVFAGRQQTSIPYRGLLDGDTHYVDTTVSGVAPSLALQWLVFDFGQREALSEAAKHTAYAANVNFNGAHQLLIYNVARNYYQYGAAKSRLAIAEQVLVNSQRLLEAAESRYANGTGTTIAVAQARQHVAQSNLRVVQAQDMLRDRYQGLLGELGVSPRTQINIASSSERPLPKADDLASLDSEIEAALSKRPDVLASYAEWKAAQAGVRAADADLMPKVFVAAATGTNKKDLSIGHLPSIGNQTTGTGVFLGVTMPIYDGGLHAAKRQQALSVAASAEAAFEKVRNGASREIIVAADALRSSLAAFDAADSLVEAAAVTHDAAYEAYINGVATITDATAAESGLLDAKLARSEAHTASLIAASTLAFTLGAMTSSASPEQAID
ncbi:TolC family protein [Halomonas halocynthiae]|uniref:TolC family protein n=1 Tax=Halomonas halocynthiae TaxID=176290 RepID=UPI001969FECB|nr:TolC family protein [Halomonas halocynthiae]